MREEYSQYKKKVNEGCMIAFVSIGALTIWLIALPLVASLYHLQSTRKMLLGPGAAVSIYILCAIYWFAVRPVMNTLMDRANNHHGEKPDSTIQRNEYYKKRISFTAATVIGAIVLVSLSKLYMLMPRSDYWRLRAAIDLNLVGLPALVGIITYKLVYRRAGISKQDSGNDA